MARAKRHHYLPQFHQRRLGVGMDGTRIWVYDKTTDAVALRPIRDTAVIGNYYNYTIRTASGLDDGLERVFGKVEASGVRRHQQAMRRGRPAVRGRPD